MMQPHTLIQNVCALASAGLGAVMAVSIGVSHKKLCALISFAAGTLLGASLFHILPESFAHLVWWEILLALGSGYLVFHWISRYVFHVCPACSASHFEEQTPEKFRGIALLLTIGLSVHSTMDGIAVSIGQEMSHTLSNSVFWTILIHKFPEGLALCALLMQGGFGKVKSVLLTITLEFSTVLGWFLGAYLLQNTSPVMIDWVMLHASGGFIYLGLHAVLNESRKHSPKIVWGFSLAGLGLMALTRFLGA